MAKKKNVDAKEVEVTESTKPAKDAKEAKKNKADKAKKAKAKSDKKSLGKKIKESASELKKVSWPTFGKTVKQTGVVIAVVVLCTLVLFGIDRLLSLLYQVLT